jgi:predicted transcriptional regulator
LSKELKGKLERLAESTKRSKSYLAAEAIAEYVDLNAWQVEKIREAIAKADAGGPFVSDDDAARYLDALAQGENPRRPRSFRVR